MKKLALLVAAGMCFLGWRLYADEIVNAPSGKVSNPINADYGGVEVATSAFTAALSTVVPVVNGALNYSDFSKSTWTGSGGFFGNIGNTKSRYRIYGIDFSTGLCGSLDFAAVYVSSVGANQGAIGAPLNGVTREVTRFYNIYNSTSIATGANGACGGITFLRWPLRVYGNLFWQASVATYNHVNLLYWQEQ